MKTRQLTRRLTAMTMAAMASISSAHATILHAPTSGTFTMHLDSAALTPYWGYYLANFWNAADSDISNPANTAAYLSSQITPTAISAINQVFELTAIGSNPQNQPLQRAVKATSANFTIDSDNLSGIAGAQIGMTGVQGFYAPYWQTACCGLGGGVTNGDFSVAFDSSRQTDGRSGWYLANNIYFTMATYDFGNLNLAFTDADNWRLSGDLWMSPENGTMLKGAILNDVGDFCLGTGSYSGCGYLSAVPLPTTILLFGSGLFAFTGKIGRKQTAHTLSRKYS